MNQQLQFYIIKCWKEYSCLIIKKTHKTQTKIKKLKTKICFITSIQKYNNNTNFKNGRSKQHSNN